MPETPTAAGLLIPPAAVDAHFVCGCSESGIRAGFKAEALGPIVAAELRRIADSMDIDRQRAEREADDARDKGDTRGADMWFARMIALAARVNSHRARADELDPPARQEN